MNLERMTTENMDRLVHLLGGLADLPTFEENEAIESFEAGISPLDQPAYSETRLSALLIRRHEPLQLVEPILHHDELRHAPGFRSHLDHQERCPSLEMS